MQSDADQSSIVNVPEVDWFNTEENPHLGFYDSYTTRNHHNRLIKESEQRDILIQNLLPHNFFRYYDRFPPWRDEYLANRKVFGVLTSTIIHVDKRRRVGCRNFVF